MDPPGSSVHGILQIRILEWVAFLFSRGSSWPRDRTWVSCTACRFFTVWASRKPIVKVKSLSRVLLFVTPWTIAYQAPPSMGFSRQEYWSALLFPSPGDLPNPGIKSGSQRVWHDWATSPSLSLHYYFRYPWTLSFNLTLSVKIC